MDTLFRLQTAYEIAEAPMDKQDSQDCPNSILSILFIHVK